MAIDQVHNLQYVFREVLHSMSRPGEISSIKLLQGKSDLDIEILESTFLVAMTLLDREVTFHIISEKQAEISEKITGYTLATETTIEAADFIIVLQDASETAIFSALQFCKQGTLTDPDLSATWIIETDFSRTSGQELTLTGPGIKEMNNLQTNLSSGFWVHRNQAVIEYPLGIDLILTDEHMQLISIPRTTKVTRSEVE